MKDHDYRHAWDLMTYHLGKTAAGVRPIGLKPSGDIDWTKYLALADGHLVSCQLGAALESDDLTCDMPDLVRRYLTAKFVLNVAQSEQICIQINELAAALNEIGTEPIFMKGAAYSVAGLYPRPGARVMGDIDVVVPKEAFVNCTARLLDLGYSIGATGSALLTGQEFVAFVHPARPVWVDLHVAPLVDRYESLLSAPELTSQSKLHRFTDGARARVPCPTHDVLISITHAQLHDRSHLLGILPLRSMLDLEILLNKYAEQIDWPSLINRFTTLGSSRALMAHLRVYESIFQDRVTDQINLGCYSQLDLRRGQFFIGRPLWQKWSARFSVAFWYRRFSDALWWRRRIAAVDRKLAAAWDWASEKVGPQ
jgi:hypothetical protein